MKYYKCPDCATYLTSKWSMLKGHFSLKHADTRAEFKGEGVGEDAFEPFVISEEEYFRVTGKGQPAIKVETGLKEDEGETPKDVTPKKTPAAGTPANSSSTGQREVISQYTGDPVGRLHQVMEVNGVDTKLVERITNIMALSPRYWTNYRELEELLVSHIGVIKRGLCQTIVSQYADGLQIPQENRGMYPFNQGWSPQSPNSQNMYPPSPYQPPPWAAPPMVDPRVAALESELSRLRDERQRDNEKRLLDRIAELEKKNEGGGEVAKLHAEVEELKKSLSSAGQAATMIIYDDKGNPMQLPADRGLMEALRRKQEVEMESMRTEQMIRVISLNGGNSDKTDSILEQMKQDRVDANKRIDELIKQIHDQQIDELKKEVKAAQDMAANSGGDGKGILDVATEAGDNLKEGAMAVAREIKESLDNGMSTLKEVLTNKPAAPATVVSRSPQEIAAIMESENKLLKNLGVQ